MSDDLANTSQAKGSKGRWFLVIVFLLIAVALAFSAFLYFASQNPKNFSASRITFSLSKYFPVGKSSVKVLEDGSIEITAGYDSLQSGIVLPPAGTRRIIVVQKPYAENKISLRFDQIAHIEVSDSQGTLLYSRNERQFDFGTLPSGQEDSYIVEISQIEGMDFLGEMPAQASIEEKSIARAKLLKTFNNPLPASKGSVALQPLGIVSPDKDTELSYELFPYGQDDYNKSLAEKAALLSMLAYESIHYCQRTKSYYSASKLSAPDFLINRLKAEGFQNIEDHNYGDKRGDNVSFVIASKTINRNECLVSLILRGTDGKVEWQGNMKVGEKGSRHENFQAANLELQASLDAYLSKHQITRDSLSFFITGHSRGAAVANLLAADLASAKSANQGQDNKPKVYAYTFATPNNTTASNKELVSYSIYNFTAMDDFVPRVPLEKWGFTKYGFTQSSSQDKDAVYFQDCLSSKQDFKSIIDGFASITSKNKITSLSISNKAATTQVMQDFAEIAPSLEDYYHKKQRPWDGQTAYDFMEGTIANLAGAAPGEITRSDQVDFVTGAAGGLLPIAEYFLKNKDEITHTHHAYTYYAATRAGVFSIFE
jgi:hypothetical protein